MFRKEKYHRCKQSGHMKEECPVPIQCFRCGELGHMKQSCSNLKIPQYSRCSVFGHMKNDCLAIERSAIECNKCQDTGHVLCDCPLQGCKLGLKQYHEMKYGQNSTVEPYNNFTDLGNAWTHSVQSNGTSTEVSSQVGSSNASTQMFKLDGEVESQVNRGGQQSDKQGTSAHGLIDESYSW